MRPVQEVVMKVLVTGGAGFIGHHLVQALLGRGHEVTVIDDLSTGQRSRLGDVEADIRFVEGSILDDAALDVAMAGQEVVFHEAALASVARSLANPARSDAVNAGGTIAVMLAAARHGVRKVVAAGSSSVYGIPRELPCQETAKPRPESPYGVSKLATELYTHTLGKHHGVDTVVLRYFNVFGPGQDPQSQYAAVVPRFTTAVLEGAQPTINGDGSISRDFTYVDNVVHANLLAAEGRATGVTCNIACGQRTTLLELLGAICAAAGRSVEPLMGPPRAGDIVHSLADISLTREELGYDVVVPFAEGVRHTVDWFAAGAPAQVRSGAGR
jgi:UDP-glucose 4-epimerase